MSNWLADGIKNKRWVMTVVPVVLACLPILLLRVCLFGVAEGCRLAYEWIDWRCGQALRRIKAWVWSERGGAAK